MRSLIRRASHLRGDRGSVTIEAALALAALVIVAAGMVGALSTMAAYIAAVDTAGAAARSYAIGVDFEPRAGIELDVREDSGLVVVTATADAPLGSMAATAIFPAEGAVGEY